MKQSYFLVIPMAAIFALDIYGQQEKPKYRTSPTGYSDTPYLPDGKWRVHDIARPKPPVVTPGSFSTDDKSGVPPSDAIVLFNGKDLYNWTGGIDKDGKARPAGWKVENGYVESTHATGDLVRTAQVPAAASAADVELVRAVATALEPVLESGQVMETEMATEMVMEQVMVKME